MTCPRFVWNDKGPVPGTFDDLSPKPFVRQKWTCPSPGDDLSPFWSPLGDGADAGGDVDVLHDAGELVSADADGHDWDVGVTVAAAAP